LSNGKVNINSFLKTNNKQIDTKQQKKHYQMGKGKKYNKNQVDE